MSLICVALDPSFEKRLQTRPQLVRVHVIGERGEPGALIRNLLIDEGQFRLCFADLASCRLQLDIWRGLYAPARLHQHALDLLGASDEGAPGAREPGERPG